MVICRQSNQTTINNSWKFFGSMYNIRVINGGNALYSSNFTPEATLTKTINTVLLITNRKPLTDDTGKTVIIEGTVNYNLVTTPSWLNGIDSVIPTNGQRLLFTSQTNGIENGIYIVNNSEIIRSSDLIDGNNAAGIFIYSNNGSINSNKFWTCTNTSGNDIVGKDNLTFINVDMKGPTGPSGLVYYQFQTTQPSTNLVNGLSYLDTTTNTLKIYNNSAWYSLT